MWQKRETTVRFTHAIILINSISLLENVNSTLKSKDWYRVSVSQPPSKNLMYTYNSPGYARVQGSERADRLAEKATKTSDLCLGSSEVLRSTRHYLRVQSLKDTTLSIAWSREAQKEEALKRSSLKGRERAIVNQRKRSKDLPWKDEKGPSSVRGSAQRSSLKGRQRAIVNQRQH